MIDIGKINQDNQEDIKAVVDWCEEIYQQQFSKYFAEVRTLFDRLQSKLQPITDGELETVLTLIPLNLFSVADTLNKFKISQEVTKLKTRQKEVSLAKGIDETSATKRQEAAALQVLEDKLLATAYSTVISRVESEMSFSRELIMGAKKIWDSRRQPLNPIGEPNPQMTLFPEEKQHIGGRLKSQYVK